MSKPTPPGRYELLRLLQEHPELAYQYHNNVYVATVLQQVSMVDLPTEKALVQLVLLLCKRVQEQNEYILRKDWERPLVIQAPPDTLNRGDQG